MSVPTPSAGPLPADLLLGSSETARRAERIVRRFVLDPEPDPMAAGGLVDRLTWAIAALESSREEDDGGVAR